MVGASAAVVEVESRGTTTAASTTSRIFSGDAKDFEEWSVKLRSLVAAADLKVNKLMKSVEAACTEEQLVKGLYKELNPDFTEGGLRFYREDISGDVSYLEHHDGRGQRSFSSKFGFRLARLEEVACVTEPKDPCVGHPDHLGGTEPAEDYHGVEGGCRGGRMGG